MRANEPKREGYVQCIFFDQDRQAHCEAASGFYSSKPGEPPRWAPNAAAVTALGKLGFDTSVKDGNYPAKFAATGSAGMTAIADLLLKSMFEAYGARAFDTLKFVAPLGGSGIELSRCRPAS